MLFCRNCGGRLILGEVSDRLICESCGKSQMIQHATNGTAEPIYMESKEICTAINTYRRAMNLFLQGESVRTLDTAAQMFRSIPDILNAKEMAEKSQQKSELLAKENSYRQAVEDMQSEDSRRIMTAVETLHLLTDFKDAPQKEAEARTLLEVAVQKDQERERESQRVKRMKQLTAMAAMALAVLIIVIVLASNAVRYHSKNLEISLSPCENYLTVRGNRYVFCYEVEIENSGLVDIKAFCAEVVIEDGETLVDTQMTASESTALVRGGKSRTLTWELTVKDEKVAQKLYDDFSDLDIEITVTQIEFADGKVKEY